MIKYILFWFPLVLIGIMNGVLREMTYGTWMNALSAHQVSTATGIIFFGLYIWYLSRKWPLESAKQAILIGIIWLGMTVTFEFLFGHFVMGHTWEHLFHDYNIFNGRLWMLVLIWVVISPYLFFRIRTN